MADKAELLRLLNLSLRLEYGIITLYPAYAEMIKDAEVAESFRKFGRESVAHADVVAGLIREMGGVPTAADISRVDYRSEFEEILQHQLELEEQAEKIYSDCLALVKGGYVHDRLRGLMKAEIYHAGYLRDLLEKRRSGKPE